MLTTIFRAYLTEQSIDHLATTLRKGGVKDLLAFFPPNKRQDSILDEHFRNAGMPQVAEWWTKRQYVALKEGIISTLKEMLAHEDSPDDVSHTTFVSAACPTRFADHYRHQEQAGRARSSRH